MKKAGLFFLVSTSKTQRSHMKWELDSPPWLSTPTLLLVRLVPQNCTGQPGACQKRSDPTQPWELEAGDAEEKGVIHRSGLAWFLPDAQPSLALRRHPIPIAWMSGGYRATSMLGLSKGGLELKHRVGHCIS